MPQAKITALGIVKAYNLIGYNAVGISSQDLTGGLEFLKNAASESQFSWISANLISKKDGMPLFNSHLSVKTGDINIGITGITDQLPAKSILRGQDYEIVGWQKTLPPVIEKLAAANDFIILLSSLDDKECKEIAKAHPSIKMIIQAKSLSANRQPFKIAPDTLLTRTGKQGKHIGVMNIKWHPESTWENPQRNNILSAKKSERDLFNRQLARYKDRPEQQANYINLKKRLEQIEATINELELSGNLVPGMKPAVSSYRNRFLAMERTMPDHLPVLDVVNEINREIKSLAEENRVKYKLKGSAVTGAKGWRKCNGCHPKQTGSWQATRHASSYLTLVEEKQHFNLECLPCHVTAFDVNNPGSSTFLPSELQVVGCEVCHGPGSQHISSPKANKPPVVTRKICLGCHTQERDSDFNFENDRKKIHLTKQR